MIRRFNQYILEDVNLDTSADIILYRLTPNSIVNLSSPGEYYVSNKSDINSNLLNKKSDDIFIITVKTKSNNIDKELSKLESEKMNVSSIVVVNNSDKCEVLEIKPFNK